MVWSKFRWCETNFQECEQHLDGVIKIMTVWSSKLMVWSNFLRCDQMLMVWWNNISVWTNVHFLEIVWSHSMVWCLHMFFPDDQAPHGPASRSIAAGRERCAARSWPHDFSRASCYQWRTTDLLRAFKRNHRVVRVGREQEGIILLRPEFAAVARIMKVWKWWDTQGMKKILKVWKSPRYEKDAQSMKQTHKVIKCVFSYHNR